MLSRLAAIGARRHAAAARPRAAPLSAVPLRGSDAALRDTDDAPFCSSTAEQPHAAYPRLFSPLTLPCGLEIRNRSLMGSMHTGLEEHRGLKEMAAFYAERAKGGAGLIVTGGVAPNREGWVLPLAGKMSTPAEAEEHKGADAASDNGANPVQEPGVGLGGLLKHLVEEDEGDERAADELHEQAVVEVVVAGLDVETFDSSADRTSHDHLCHRAGIQ